MVEGGSADSGLFDQVANVGGAGLGLAELFEGDLEEGCSGLGGPGVKIFFCDFLWGGDVHVFLGTFGLKQG